MFTMTEPAGAHLAQMLASTDAPDEVVIRLEFSGSDLALRLDNEQDNDTSFQHDGKTVLVLDEAMSEMLESNTLDVEETEEGLQLALV